jgi:hypothetical protein
VALIAQATAHESPIDHVERELRFGVEEGKLFLSYRLQQTERAALMELQQMDGDADGKNLPAEQEAFFAKKGAMIAKQFVVSVDGKPLAFAPVGAAECDARLGQTFVFAAPLPKLGPGRHEGLLIDGYSRAYPGMFRWKEAGQGRPGDIRIVPVTQPEDPRSSRHPAWLELKFEVVVPE